MTLTCEVTDITAQEDSAIGSGSDQSRYMSGRMARHVQDIERSIAKVIVCLISTYLEVITERRLDHIPAFEIFFVEDRSALRKAWLEGGFESWSHDEIC